MLYAIVENGGKQYKAIEGAFIDLDYQKAEIGQRKVLDKVLLLSDEDNLQVGMPILPDVKVETTVIEHYKSPKILIFKYRPKQRYRVKTGHRQNYTRVVVDAIVFPGKKTTSSQTDGIEAAGESALFEKKSQLKRATSQNNKSSRKEKSPATKKESALGEIKPKSLPVDKLDLGAKATSALIYAGINTTAQLAKMLELGEAKLLEVPGIGAKTVEDIKKKLKKLGY